MCIRDRDWTGLVWFGFGIFQRPLSALAKGGFGITQSGVWCFAKGGFGFAKGWFRFTRSRLFVAPTPAFSVAPALLRVRDVLAKALEDGIERPPQILSLIHI